MEQRDLQLIEKYIHGDRLLDTLYHQHVGFERQLDKFNNKPFLTPSEEIERKNLQKLKLRGRDRIEEILSELRKREAI